ncbi:MAG: hypothetical protein RSD23_09470 [Ruthenibacterium sp.]
MMTYETKKAKTTEWLKSYMSDCDSYDDCKDCLFMDLCLVLDDCAPRIIVEIIEQQREEIKHMELSVLERFIRKMPETYRKRTLNWSVVEHILLAGTCASGCPFTGA